MKVLLAAGLALWIGGSVDPAVAQSPRPGAPVTCPEEEAACLRALPGLARRSGRLLALKLPNGKKKRFQDTPDGCGSGSDSCKEFRLVGYAPASGTFLVGYRGYEEASTVVVNARTGGTTWIGSDARLSPSGKLVVVLGYPDENLSAEDKVSIWRLTAGEPRRVFAYSAPENRPNGTWDFVEWRGDAEVVFDVRVPEAEGESRASVTIRLTGDGWQLVRPK